MFQQTKCGWKTCPSTTSGVLFTAKSALYSCHQIRPVYHNISWAFERPRHASHHSFSYNFPVAQQQIDLDCLCCSCQENPYHLINLRQQEFVSGLPRAPDSTPVLMFFVSLFPDTHLPSPFPHNASEYTVWLQIHLLTFCFVIKRLPPIVALCIKSEKGFSLRFCYLFYLCVMAFAATQACVTACPFVLQY